MQREKKCNSCLQQHRFFFDENFVVFVTFLHIEMIICDNNYYQNVSHDVVHLDLQCIVSFVKQTLWKVVWNDSGIPSRHPIFRAIICINDGSKKVTFYHDILQQSQIASICAFLRDGRVWSALSSLLTIVQALLGKSGTTKLLFEVHNWNFVSSLP